ncbi:LPS biosynthesis protein [Bifidobacterium margollesii]|uniref:LPS biosynthesis protein n=1 Tax=Bifidobacterium margollesii TaxID=2020964 RepID=A0A2N5J8Z1_9BIFI|nr:acyltransferase [Bifidobacterium margollesii]PLS30673.1 LPS biosynthesis protein [Bifidobacterium margollesii]
MNVQKAWWFAKTQLTRFRYGHVGGHSYIAKPLFLQRTKALSIGNNVRIYPGMRLEVPESTASVVIEDNVSIGQNFHVVSYSSRLVIGRGTTISGNVFISNVNHGYREIDVDALHQEMIEKETVIGENCFIGYGAVVLPGSHLGKQCIVGANAVVAGDFPDYSVIAGVPAKIIKQYDVQSGAWVKP